MCKLFGMKFHVAIGSPDWNIWPIKTCAIFVHHPIHVYMYLFIWVINMGDQYIILDWLSVQYVGLKMLSIFLISYLDKINPPTDALGG